jgi:alpha-L-fucosidase
MPLCILPPILLPVWNGGYGDEKESIFNPIALNTRQWAKTLKETGFKTLILTTKHHDGFCLWPSNYTEHSIKNSPYKNGKGDLVKETAEAAKKYGLKFGVYLSPWDRNHPEYGKPAYRKRPTNPYCLWCLKGFTL